jgi:hypothetical protein
VNELTHLLTDWAFEIISGGVFFAVGLLVPEKWNPVKRLVARHDRDKHPSTTPAKPDYGSRYKCPGCERRFPRRDAVIVHMQEDHGY